MYSYFILLSVLLFAGHPDARPHPAMLPNTEPQIFQTGLIYEFRVFREALGDGPWQRFVKKRIQFPIINPTNDIWYLVLSEQERKEKKLDGEAIPFTNKDFDQYHRRIFPPEFVKCIMHITTDVLFSKGETSSPEFKFGENRLGKMNAVWVKKENRLVLNMAFKNAVRDAGGNITGWAESTVIYSFNIINNKNLRLSSISLAG